MIVSNLNFYDKFGKNLNFDLDSTGTYFEGKIYFPELSAFLFDNENIFILEKIGSDYKFPALNPGESISFEWKNLDNETNLFIYDVEKDFELNNFFINKKDSLTVGYDDILPTSDGSQIDISLPLQLNVAFNPAEEIKYSRVLHIYYTDQASPSTRQKIAEIEFYGEGLEEDLRFGVWARNFGIKFNREDANILKDYDIKEAYPDWKQLNLARKTLLVNKEHVYPYIGTYKGLSNFVNLLGYKDILQIKEYWKNINSNSPYYNKQALVDITDYLDDGKIDNMNILDRNFNIKHGKQFRKTEFLALVYQFNRETGNFDDDGIPEIEETTTFTVDEVFYKLNRLKDKLKNEFLPINVKIRDIIGEFLYFQKITIKFWKDDTPVFDFDMNEKAEVQSYPDSNVNLILRSLSPLFRKDFEEGLDFGSVQLNEGFKNPYEFGQKYSSSDIPGIVNYIKEFYNQIKIQKYPDIGKKLTWEDGDGPEKIIGAPVIFNIYTEKFTFENFKGVTFQDVGSLVNSIDPYFTLENLDFKNFHEITWKITKDSPNPYNFTYRGKIKDLDQLPHFLPYVGTYRVTAELHDFYGNTSVFSKFINVESSQKPQIIAVTRLEDKFNYSIDNLKNVRLSDFGASPNYYPRVNVLDNESTIGEIDVYKNLLEWQWYYKNRYGTGQNMYDVELWDTETQKYVAYSDPTQDHPKKSYWGLGTDRHPMKLSDFKDMTLKSMFWLRLSDLIYTDDFNAGFYIHDPKPGQEIHMSLFDPYVIPYFSSLDNLVDILNSSNHPGIRLFNYEVIRGRKSDKQYIIHAQAEYLSKEMYHILESGTIGSPSPGSPVVTSASPSPGGSGLAALDKYTFFLSKEIYSDRLINFLQSISPVFDVETLFLLAKTSDLIKGTVQDPNFWVDKKYWKFNNGLQTGHLPTVIDENAFNINDIKVFEDSFNLPENGVAFFSINNIDGKTEFIWTLFNSITGEEIVRTRSVPFFVWKFKDLGRYTIKVEVHDNKGSVYVNQIDKMINVVSKNQYISNIETRLNRRKLELLNENN
jgi:hypothetical protein